MEDNAPMTTPAKVTRLLTIDLNVTCEPEDPKLQAAITEHLQKAAEHLAAAFHLAKQKPGDDSGSSASGRRSPRRPARPTAGG